MRYGREESRLKPLLPTGTSGEAADMRARRAVVPAALVGVEQAPPETEPGGQRREPGGREAQQRVAPRERRAVVAQNADAPRAACRASARRASKTTRRTGSTSRRPRPGTTASRARSRPRRVRRSPTPCRPRGGRQAAIRRSKAPRRGVRDRSACNRSPSRAQCRAATVMRRTERARARCPRRYACAYISGVYVQSYCSSVTL